MLTDPGSLLGEGVDDVDREVLSRPDVGAVFRRIVAEQAVNGVGGCVDDTLAFARPWGFDLADVAVPVLLAYGLRDVSCPPDHGRWLAGRLRTTVVVEDEDGGHLPRDLEAEIAWVFGWLRTGDLPRRGGREP